jgi:hypothetical protein
MSFNNVGKGQASDYFKKINSGLETLEKQNSDSGVKQMSYHTNRVPWIMSTTEWLEKGKGITWFCNPSDISWSMRLRQATTKNANSTVTHNWPNNNRGTHFDEFVITMTLQTGNLMHYNRANPRTDSLTNIVSPGLVNFYDFLQLMDAPKLTANGRTNHVVIKYNSNIFPKLTLIGQFDPEGVKFNDTSQDPNNVNSWSVSFIVYDSNPRLSDNIRTDNGPSNSVLLQNALSNMFYKQDVFKEQDNTGNSGRQLFGPDGSNT